MICVSQTSKNNLSYKKKNLFGTSQLLIYIMQVNCKRDVSGTLYSEPTIRIEAAQYFKLEGKKHTVILYSLL